MDVPKLLIKRLEDCGYEAYAVGGCVRDMLMGRDPDDYDITTNAKPEQIKNCFQDLKTVLTGEKHGTVGVITDIGMVEITTYRTDGEYKDSRHPENVSFTSSLKDDLSRRDFTVNAMAYSSSGEVIDLFGGREDLKNKIIRCVGDPKKRFKEDALRIMRALRFASTLGFDIEASSENAIGDLHRDLLNISSERIFTELCKLLCGERAKDILCRYPHVICTIIPELKKSVGFNQQNIHYCYDVYTHSAYAVQNCPPDIPLRLAALLHDCGKPDCFFVGKDGQGHFYGHAAKSEEMAFSALARLKCSNEIKNLVCELVRIHDREIVNTVKAVKRFLSVASPGAAERIFSLKKADTLSQAPEYHSRVKGLEETEATMHRIIDNNECVSYNSLEIDGRDLMELGLKPGKELGEIKKAILSAVIDGEVENEKNSLVAYAKMLIDQKY